MTDEKTTDAVLETDAPTVSKAPVNWKSSKTYYMARLAILTAIVIVMAFTPLGYLKIGAVEGSFLTVPVIIGAIWLGPSAGAILGSVFGLTSFFQCFGLSAFGAALLEISPISAFIVCFFPRLLMGWLVGVIFKGLHFVKPLRFSAYTVSSFMGAALNTSFFMTALIGLYGQTDYIINMKNSLGAKSVLSFVFAFVGVNALIELVVCTILGMAISRILAAVDKKSLEKAKNRSEKEAATLAEENEQLKSDKGLLSEANALLNDNLKVVTNTKNEIEAENKSLKEKLMDKLDKDDNGKIDLLEKKPKKTKKAKTNEEE